jgi:hypothetical protein
MRTNGLEAFRRELQNYDYGVRQVIPASPQALPEADEAFSDELESLLFARDWLERELRAHSADQAYQPLGERIQELDALLRAKRPLVLTLVPNYARWRDTLKEHPPQAHWWWYLDQVEAEYESQQAVVSLADHLGVVFDEDVVARVGLRAGQPVTVRVSDKRHILIAVSG